MEPIAWRYHPEFVIRILIDGEGAGDTVEVQPSATTAGALHGYGMLTRPLRGGLLCCVRQRHTGTGWVAAVAIERPVVFSFWLKLRQGEGRLLPAFFVDGTQRFGRKIFYANNLSAAGAIDVGGAGGSVRLTQAARAGAAERGALSGALLSTSFTAGEFTQLRAGAVRAGAAVSFTIAQPIVAEDVRAGLDFSLRPKGAYVVRLQGSPSVQERVVVDQAAVRAEVGGVIDIFRDDWHLPAQPRVYRADFASA
jgi:hypothetical protein